MTTCTFVLGVLPAFANTTDSSTIKISVVHDARMTFEGTALSGNKATISMADIRRKQAVNLGTLNVKSVTNYDVAFKSANGYRLKDANETLAEYKIKYDGQNIVLTSTRLNSHESKTGIYQDTLTVIITAP
ncbi:MAG TPA: hypothetical protein EYG71_06650 [Leucothrix sp.]|nr:hypothetical protein [Leucothrix sp.]